MGMVENDYIATGQVYNCYYLYRRKGPSTSYGTNGSYERGDKVSITKKSGSWYYVDNKGWSQSAYIKIISAASAGTLTLTSDSKLYQDKSTSSKVLKTILKGTKLSYSQKSGYWYKVTTSDKVTGWVYSKGNSTNSNNSATGSCTIKNDTKVYKEANTSSEVVGSISKNTNVAYTKKSGDWYYISYTSTLSSNKTTIKGWVQSSDLTNISTKSLSQLNKELEAKANEESKIIYKALLSQYSSSQDTLNSLITNNLNGIHGMPYQFMSTVDPKLSGSVFGGIYAEKIVSTLPLLLMTPGKVEFMADYKTGQKEGILNLLHDVTNNDADFTSSDISSILSEKESGRYYSFAFDYDEYWKYVDSLLRTCAIFLGIQDVPIKFGDNKLTKLGEFEWKEACNTSFNSYLSSTRDTIGFYVDSVNTVDESFSNDLTDSQIASKVNSFSDYGREVRYLLGYGAGSKNVIDNFIDENKDAFNSAISEIGSITDKFLKGSSNLFSNIGNCFATVATGGKIAFPQIWSDSSFSRTYTINMKLRCPDPNPVSWFLDVNVPLMHLLGMTMPRQCNPNGYNAPFLVRAFYKGLFNCDMGIITNVSVTKGKEGAWTLDGLPTQVDVTVEIKDLYNVLYMTEYTEKKWFMNNPCLLNYLATSCGININEIDMQRDLMVYLMLSRENMPIISPLRRQWSAIMQNIDNKLLRMYENNILKW